MIWEKYFKQLLEFKKMHGHSNVSTNFESPKLRRWVVKQRYKKKILSAGRIRRLNEIGFIWEVNSTRWENNFLKLKEFKKIKGHCNVPQVYKEDRQLGTWVAEQRNTIYDDRFIERRKRLDEIGFSWSPTDEQWEKQFKKLLDFKEKYGHLKVSKNFDCDPVFKTWVKVQRRKINMIDPDKRKKLHDIGFVWSPHSTNWEEIFLKLVDFKNTYGHCNVPRGFVADPSLGFWVSSQRMKEESLDDERKKRLNEIGFTWSVSKRKAA